jgi:hypothetical protein
VTNPLLELSAAGIRAALKPTDELSSLSSRAKPVVLWGSVRRIQIASEQDRHRECYRDAEWKALSRLADGLYMMFSATRQTSASLARGMSQFASALQRS